MSDGWVPVQKEALPLPAVEQKKKKEEEKVVAPDAWTVAKRKDGNYFQTDPEEVVVFAQRLHTRPKRNISTSAFKSENQVKMKTEENTYQENQMKKKKNKKRQASEPEEGNIVEVKKEKKKRKRAETVAIEEELLDGGNEKKEKKKKKKNIGNESLNDANGSDATVSKKKKKKQQQLAVAGDTKKQKQKSKKKSSSVQVTQAEDDAGVEDDTKKKKKVKEKAEDHQAFHHSPGVDVVFLTEKRGNTDEIRINQERRQALQLEVDKASQPERPAKPSGLGQWSTAHFNSSEQQQKFLRLMGGFKKGFQPAAADAGKANMALGKDEQQQLQKGLLGEFERAHSRRMDFNNRGAGLGFTAPSNKKFSIDINACRSVRFDD
ncbi:hypothetical protein INR49_026458 [Caranx melampygus]|nr:hypothetical protein INR49_026458 [Caranx melampygus]